MILNLFSKRQKQARGEVPDVYVYDALPVPLRVQIVHIFQDMIGADGYHSNGIYKLVDDALCRERGLFHLVRHAESHHEAVRDYFLNEKSTEYALDVVELIFKLVDYKLENDYGFKNHAHRKIDFDDAVIELNGRFKEHGVGYQFEGAEIIRVDSEFLHAEAVKPTLAILRDNNFKGASDEFLKAHEHYRHKRFKESLVEALKALESTMKTVCKLRGWKTQPNDTAKNLIAVCFDNGLFPAYFQTQFSSMRQLLESGVPTVRNKVAGHGQGADPLIVPEYLARYALNLSATTILLIVEAHQAKK